MKLIRVTLTAFAISSLFISCGTDEVETTETETTVSLNGASLYAANCSSCHGSLSSSAVRGFSASQIQNAIATQPSMASIDISNDEIDAISSVLND